MDARITKKRIGHMLSYDWIKIIAIAAAAIVLWSLLFTMVATRATIGQSFYLYSFYDVSMRNTNVNELENLHKENALSYDILEVTDSTFADNQYLSQQMAAYFSARQGDVMLITDIKPEPSKEGEETYSNLQSVASAYYSLFARLNGAADGKPDYFESCAQYLNGFYEDGDYTSERIDEGKLEASFRARMKKDKRFKTEKQIRAGLVQERARIENLKSAYINVTGELKKENGAISVKETMIAKGADAEKLEPVHIAIDLSKLEHIAEYATNTKDTKSAEGLCMVVFDWASDQPDLQFEPITYLDFLLRKYN